MMVASLALVWCLLMLSAPAMSMPPDMATTAHPPDQDHGTASIDACPDIIALVNSTPFKSLEETCREQTASKDLVCTSYAMGIWFAMLNPKRTKHYIQLSNVDHAELACLCGDMIAWRDTAVSCGERSPRIFPFVAVAAAAVVTHSATIAAAATTISAVVVTAKNIKDMLESGHSGLESGHSGLESGHSGLGGQPEGHLEVCHNVLTYANSLHSLVGLCDGVETSYADQCIIPTVETLKPCVQGLLLNVSCTKHIFDEIQSSQSEKECFCGGLLKMQKMSINVQTILCPDGQMGAAESGFLGNLVVGPFKPLGPLTPLGTLAPLGLSVGCSICKNFIQFCDKASVCPHVDMLKLVPTVHTGPLRFPGESGSLPSIPGLFDPNSYICDICQNFIQAIGSFISVHGDIEQKIEEFVLGFCDTLHGGIQNLACKLFIRGNLPRISQLSSLQSSTIVDITSICRIAKACPSTPTISPISGESAPFSHTGSGESAPWSPHIGSSDDECRCGVLQEGTRSYGGKPAEGYVWNVYIKTPDSFCTGSLLDHTTVLTAAHCVEKKLGGRWEASELELYVGTFDIRAPQMIRGVSRIHVHDDWVSSGTSMYSASDIAMLKLDRWVGYSKSVVPVCLPTNPGLSFAHEDGVATGWGSTADDEPQYQEDFPYQLMGVNVTVLTSKLCPGIKDDVHICAMGVDDWEYGTRSGDSGGPLNIVDPTQTRHPDILHRYAVIGVNSFNSKPDVFAKITPKIKSWIKGIATGAKDSNCE